MRGRRLEANISRFVEVHTIRARQLPEEQPNKMMFYRRRDSDRRFISPEGRIHCLQDALVTHTVEGRFGR